MKLTQDILLGLKGHSTMENKYVPTYGFRLLHTSLVQLSYLNQTLTHMLAALDKSLLNVYVEECN